MARRAGPALPLSSPQVFLNGTRGQVYHSQQVGPPGSAISPDLLVDSSGSHLYVLTSQQVRAVPGVGGEHTRPEAPQPPPPYPAACPGGPLTRGSLPPVPRLQQLPPGPGPPVRLVRPAGQVSGGRFRSTSRWARRPGRVPEVGRRAVAEFPHPALRAQPRIWWASPSPHCPACPLLLPPAPSGPGLHHLSQVSPGPLQLLSSPRSSQQPQESLTATLSQVHVLMRLAPSSLSRVPFTPTACCTPAGPSSQAPCRKSPREPESYTGTQRAPAPQVYPQGPMRAGSPAQPVAMELRGRPLPAHPEPAAGPPSPPGAGPGQMPAAACRHLPGRGLPRLPPLPLPPLPALPCPGSLSLGELGPPGGPRLLCFPRMRRRSPCLCPGCPPSPWTNTSTVPLGTMTAWLTWKGPTWPASPLPKTSCRITLQAQVRGPRGEGQGGSRRGRSHMATPATTICPPEHITLPLALMFEDVVVATANFSFYDCGAVQALDAAAP